MKIKPLFNRVLVLPEQKTVSESGILIPVSAGEHPQIGSVVAVGDGKTVDNEKVDMQVSVGDKVVFNKFAGSEIEMDNKTYILIDQIDIMGVIYE